MYYHIIRPDGSFVIQNPNTELLDFFEQLQNQPAAVTDKSFAKNTIEDFGLALRAHKEYAAILEINDEARQIYGTPLPYSEWYLVAVMPYSVLSGTIDRLSSQRMVMTLLACASVLMILTLIFRWYFSITLSLIHI